MERSNSFTAKAGRWATELILVFAGVYGAFWLNSYQEHQRDAKRRDQILASLQENVQEEIVNAEHEGTDMQKKADEFRRALDAGEMPPVHTFNWTSTHSANDYAAFLQAGGLELLDIKTISALHKAEGVLRAGLSELAHFQKLSDELVMPNLDQDIFFFYDPATKKLRKRFAAYPSVLEATAEYFRQMAAADKALLAQIEGERKKR